MQTVVELKNVGKSFHSSNGIARAVLDDVDFTLREGEIVALLGQSGSGKSTLLRIMAGLINADAGEVLYRGQPIYGPARGIGMVFQSFALFPWLTVQQNVELGLEARGMPPEERAKRAEAAIELIGLSGFEGALPRELSGGMRQRVGIARALVIEPEVLLMDEAFSALDVLTGERLREDILELWQAGSMPTKAMLVVSHNIEEAVLMADRILIFATDPGRVRFQLSVQLPRPRNPDSQQVRTLIDEVYTLMTAGVARPGRPTEEPARLPLTARLPEANVSSMEGVLELLAEEPFKGRADLPRLVEESELTDDELLPIANALNLLGFALVAHGDVSITPLGQRFVQGSKTLRQEVFGQQLLAHVPLAAHIRNSLEQEPSGELPEEPFLKLLRESMDEEEAERVLRVAIEWSRYGEVFEYNYRTGLIHLPEGEEIEETE
ncbi:MAG TPA: nitrate/sulfonate/bicarbonate ABC transporter ATP-binding protein [Rhodocyclaceae bacterium]|nr:nitrate/sulfonate/bicarbonate ABC transporter ATP-binding protein [Rhodocyclaceae bacterium]